MYADNPGGLAGVNGLVSWAEATLSPEPISDNSQVSSVAAFNDGDRVFIAIAVLRGNSGSFAGESAVLEISAGNTASSLKLVQTTAFPTNGAVDIAVMPQVHDGVSFIAVAESRIKARGADNVTSGLFRFEHSGKISKTNEFATGLRGVSSVDASTFVGADGTSSYIVAFSCAALVNADTSQANFDHDSDVYISSAVDGSGNPIFTSVEKVPTHNAQDSLLFEVQGSYFAAMVSTPINAGAAAPKIEIYKWNPVLKSVEPFQRICLDGVAKIAAASVGGQTVLAAGSTGPDGGLTIFTFDAGQDMFSMFGVVSGTTPGSMAQVGDSFVVVGSVLGSTTTDVLALTAVSKDADYCIPVSSIYIAEGQGSVTVPCGAVLDTVRAEGTEKIAAFFAPRDASAEALVLATGSIVDASEVKVFNDDGTFGLQLTADETNRVDG
jgi:hypothetical protein